MERAEWFTREAERRLTFAFLLRSKLTLVGTQLEKYVGTYRHSKALIFLLLLQHLRSQSEQFHSKYMTFGAQTSPRSSAAPSAYCSHFDHPLGRLSSEDIQSLAVVKARQYVCVSSIARLLAAESS
jgi:hypothetical protein